MTFEDKISIVLRTNKLGISTSEELSEKCGFDTSTIRKVIEREQKEITAGSGKTPSLNLGNLRTLWDKIGINPDWWETGEGEVFIAASPEKHTREENEAAIPENALGEQELFQRVVRVGSTEYVVMPKTTLDGEYRIMPKNELDKYERQFDKIDQRTQVALNAKDEVIQMKDELLRDRERQLKEREERILSLERQLSGAGQQT